jgi:putative phage-type endonuclease
VKVLTAEERLAGLGATDVAAIVGVSKYATPIDVYLEKRGEQPPKEQTARMRMGQLLEDAIADAYSEQTGRRLARMGVVFHRDYPHLFVHPDRRIVGEPGLVEIKATMHAREYEHGVPAGVAVQCQWQMALTGRLFVDVVVLGGTHGIEEPIRVDRDQELIDALIDVANRFWHENVLAGVPPAVDGSDSYRRYLAERRRETEVELVATAEVQLVLEELAQATVAQKRAEAHVELLKNRIREAMGDATRLVSPRAVVTWRTEAPRTPWKELCLALAAEFGIDIDQRAEALKATLEGQPVLRIAWRGEPQ